MIYNHNGYIKLWMNFMGNEEIKEGTLRILTTGEITLARSIFGNSNLFSDFNNHRSIVVIFIQSNAQIII